MENETDILHLLTTHQIVLFLLGAVVITLLLLLIRYVVGRRSGRKHRDEDSGEN